VIVIRFISSPCPHPSLTAIITDIAIPRTAMPTLRSNNRNETFEQWRQRMLDETARFIEWGLANPDKINDIPMNPLHRGGAACFSERLKSTFWNIVLRNPGPPQ